MYSSKKKHRNPFTFLFNKQYKSNPSIVSDKQELALGIFGVPLCDASNTGSILWDLKVPDPVALCFNEISKRGLTTEGIFRLSGATSEVILLENKINESSSDERKQINSSQFDIHTLTSLVKKYLRELPEPVIPNAYHEHFQDIDLSNTRQGLGQLSLILVKLPSHNRHLLHAILLMASKIQQHVHLNMMCPEALATVFAPVCTGFEQSLKDMKISNSSSTSSTFRKQRKYSHDSHMLSSNELIEKHIKRNKHWTNIWKLMIEQHQALICILNKQHAESMENNKSNLESSWNKKHVHYAHQQLNRSLPSPFSTSNSTPPLPNDIIMAQFYPINQNSIPVAPSVGRNTNIYMPSSTTPSPPPPPTRTPPPPVPAVPASYYEDSSRPSIQHSISKKASFFQKSNTIRKILSASTLR
ncbi:Rho GTPase activation protein [Helicostylum pulchrum]|nr:Rho GTPase activation protein [Helicostylum pulchrum]